MYVLVRSGRDKEPDPAYQIMDSDLDLDVTLFFCILP